MAMTPDEVYTDLLKKLASPIGVQPEALAETFREVERMHSTGQIEDWQMQNAREAYARTRSKVADAASWAMDKAKAATEQGRRKAQAAVASYTVKDPVQAMLIAAGVGAVLMGLVRAMARSGVRSVRRRVRR